MLDLSPFGDKGTRSHIKSNNSEKTLIAFHAVRNRDSNTLHRKLKIKQD
jgi:hypothetical protein